MTLNAGNLVKLLSYLVLFLCSNHNGDFNPLLSHWTFLHSVDVSWCKSNTILSVQNCLMHQKVALKSMKFSCLKRGMAGNDLVVDSLFLTLCNVIPFLGNSCSLDSELVLGTKCYNIEKTELSSTQVRLDCLQVRSWEKWYLGTKPELCFAWHWYCFCTMWLERPSKQNQKLTVTTAKSYRNLALSIRSFLHVAGLYGIITR